MQSTKMFVPLVIICIFIKTTSCSSGDSAPIYQRCLHRCGTENCTNGKYKEVMFTFYYIPMHLLFQMEISSIVTNSRLVCGLCNGPVRMSADISACGALFMSLKSAIWSRHSSMEKCATTFAESVVIVGISFSGPLLEFWGYKSQLLQSFHC